ncbi:MAG: pyridoxamine 5'-phosphate oxidase family protein [Tistlia sp.]|uniref:pyridoxamine 5'-phosphate oxidase family protein n=1 Tax=Tistlia sp. TaxID=3057121 RepID=UPI0034A3DFED
MSNDDFTPTERTRIRRLAKRAVWDREAVYGVLDAGLACHVGYVIEGQPYVTPTAYARIGDRVLWHGSSASRMLRQVAQGVPVCFTVSLLDGLVHARSGFHSSFNYRSVMAFGTAEEVTGAAEKTAALEAIVERITPGRWADLRPLNGQELKATKVLSLRLEEVACKIREGGPNDDEEDYALPIWAGEVPIRLVLGEPVEDARLAPGIARPAYLKDVRLG